jgi:SAM-dependent methyltransferase
VDSPPIRDHWDQAWSGRDVADVDPQSFPYDRDATHRFFGQRLQEMDGSEVLEIGCGQGRLAVHLAERGAQVTAVDVSPEAVQMAQRNAAHNGVDDRMTVRTMDALDLESLPQTYDLVVGRFILHHIEPFSEFVEVLESVTTPSAQGLFLENSARNRLLMLFRNYLTGRFGIPKYGDDEEHPLTRREIDALRTAFDVQVHRPELVFFKKMNTYLIGYDNGWEGLVEFIESLDDILYRVLPALRKYSYLQVVELRK